MVIEEEDKKLPPLDRWEVKFKIYETFTCRFKFISLAALFLEKTRSFENAAACRENKPQAEGRYK
jgi:hypothetical protein